MTVLTPEIAMPLVEAGGRWLDERDPAWLLGIDKERLDLGSPKLCVLGQRTKALTEYRWASSYFITLNYLGLDDRWAIEHGFIVGLNYRYDGAAYEVLTLCWLEYITKRLKGLAT